MLRRDQKELARRRASGKAASEAAARVGASKWRPFDAFGVGHIKSSNRRGETTGGNTLPAVRSRMARQVGAPKTGEGPIPTTQYITRLEGSRRLPSLSGQGH